MEVVSKRYEQIYSVCKLYVQSKNNLQKVCHVQIVCNAGSLPVLFVPCQVKRGSLTENIVAFSDVLKRSWDTQNTFTQQSQDVTARH